MTASGTLPSSLAEHADQAGSHKGTISPDTTSSKRYAKVICGGHAREVLVEIRDTSVVGASFGQTELRGRKLSGRTQ